MNDLSLLFANKAESSTPLALLGLLIIWSTVWKGFALWKAARLSSKGWFIALLIFNTAGLLEIIYIFLIAKQRKKATQTSL